MADLTVPTTVSIGQAQLGGAKPLCYGPAHITGNNLLLNEYTDATYGAQTRIALLAWGIGEWDGIDRLWVGRQWWWPDGNPLVHFHPGTDTPLDCDMHPVSNGGDQLVDSFFTLLPGGVTPLAYSQLAYLMLKIPPDPNAPTADLDVIADVRTLKCRTFDASGNQTGYAYTKNPAWWILDLCIRYVVKREGLVNQALASAEKARFDFSSFSDLAAYNDYTLAAEDNAPRFEGGMAVAQPTNLTDVQEKALLMCRAYLIERAGVIYAYPDEPRSASIVVTSDAVIPERSTRTRSRCALALTASPGPSSTCCRQPWPTSPASCAVPTW